MLFNSLEFLFLYLPVLLVVFFVLARRSHRLAASWLTLGSLFFYAYWDPHYVLLLLGSIVFNYLVGYVLARGDDVGCAAQALIGCCAVGVTQGTAWTWVAPQSVGVRC